MGGVPFTACPPFFFPAHATLISFTYGIYKMNSPVLTRGNIGKMIVFWCDKKHYCSFFTIFANKT